MDDNANSAKQLNQLLEANIDAEKTYTSAAEEIKNETLQKYFHLQASKRSKFAVELTTEILGLGGTPVESGSTEEKFHRTWAKFRSAVGNNDEKRALEECLRVDRENLKAYEAVAALHNVKTAAINMLNDQKKSIEENLEQIKSLEDISRT